MREREERGLWWRKEAEEKVGEWFWQRRGPAWHPNGKPWVGRGDGWGQMVGVSKAKQRVLNLSWLHSSETWPH